MSAERILATIRAKRKQIIKDKLGDSVITYRPVKVRVDCVSGSTYAGYFQSVSDGILSLTTDPKILDKEELLVIGDHVVISTIVALQVRWGDDN